MTNMQDKIEALKQKIYAAFAEVEYPGDWCLRGSNEGDEPYLLQKEFKGHDDWRKLDAEFIDQAPDGFATALCFFSDEAFRFYLPAYLIADIDGKLEQTNLVFYLCDSLTNKAKIEKVNPKRYGERTWFERGRYQFAVFNKAQASAIAAYLRFKQEIPDTDEWDKDSISEALQNFWLERASR